MAIKCILNSKRKSIVRSRGVTLLEVLLYIGMFTVICTSVIFLYISILKVTYSIKINIDRAEFAFFVYEIARFKIDRGIEYLKIEDFSRILKYYPNLSMSEISLERVHNSGEILAHRSLYINETQMNNIKVSYKLVFKSLNAISEKVFIQTFYINPI